MVARSPTWNITLFLPFFCLAAQVAQAEPGVSDQQITFGQTAALEGPAAALGTGMREGILAAFEEVNRAGGVGGRKLVLKSYDDGYEPDKAIANMQKLVFEDQVFAVIGAVGTPTSTATQPIATEAGMPFIAPFTGAGFLRDPALENVINIRATYELETETWIRHLTEDLNYTKIAILYQDDSYGRAGLDGVMKAMEKRGLELVAEGTYQRNTTAVKSALLDIRKGKPEAVVMVGAYKAIGEFIRQAKKINLDSTFVNISFVGSEALAAELGKDGEGVVITQVVPFPWDDSLPLVARYLAALSANDPAAKPGFVSLEGYMAARLTIMALEKMEADISREKLLQTVRSTGTFDLGGVTLTFGPGDNQGSEDVFLTVIQPDGSFRAISSLAGTS